MIKAPRWTTAELDSWAKRRIARRPSAEQEFDREMLTLAPAAIAIPTRAPPVRLPIAGRLYPLVLLCEAHGLPAPQPEYNFSAARGWRFDYAFVDQKIAVEIEGGVWRRGGGAHSHPLGILRDIEKYNAAAVLGWRILRVVPEKLADVIESLKAILR